MQRNYNTQLLTFGVGKFCGMRLWVVQNTCSNISVQTDLFLVSLFSDMLNPNGCTAKGTFFVSHKYTNYSAVQEFHRKGHEIGVFSITRRQDPKYWTKGTYDDWLAEMAGDRYGTRCTL